MKMLSALLLSTGLTYGQTLPKLPAWDSLAETYPQDRMPNVRPSTSFYRSHEDPDNVARATLDNLPVKKADSTVHYHIMSRYPQQPYPSTPKLPVMPPQPLPYPPQRRSPHR
ncbi:hypothetical protein [Spirosoma utsteinense]|uniref:Uncharacterized protein n=1 Tax=Spirosoma utsteinense TaxID=2585773 RepID=A0ABR6W5P2_9BACT|nr:hypothetical protein [Spirosoma utsteinense]MBC3786290.1 hypothetical protein [Spirosoma utsteinense]MBC3791916.1 hypothetical protein [Spirosoma utsteinense]